MADKQYGMYSAGMAEITGTLIYSTPSGEEVEVTSVGSDPNFSGIKLDDKILKGEVVKFLRDGKPPTRQRSRHQYLS